MCGRLMTGAVSTVRLPEGGGGATGRGRSRWGLWGRPMTVAVSTVRLPGVAEATPMTFEGRDGKQYVVIAATGGGFFNNPVTGDALIAYRLE